ncbi:MAG: glycosyltransferase family 4 protein [Bacteroidales bacterium]
MKRILYLTFYFEPDLSAGSFRNTPLVKELAKQATGIAEIDVMTTLPNRYSSFVAEALEYEEIENYYIRRIAVPKHQSGMMDQILSFQTYYDKVIKLTKNKKYDLVIASSSKLFTAFLGYRIARKKRIPLYLDIRDIFYDTLEDLLSNKLVKKLTLPVIKQVEKRTFEYASHINLISGGFKSYFTIYNKAEYTTFPNGIDDIFIEANKNEKLSDATNRIMSIVYAGNIGEGQGLHKIVPQVASQLKDKVRFKIIGDGGAKQKLIDGIKEHNLDNVELRPPVKRDELIEEYKKADFLFVHLNDFKAFRKVLPSKLFELAVFNKPIIAGVAGFAATFVSTNIENSILFEPCNAAQFVNLYNQYEYKQVKRTEFIAWFKRDAVNQAMAKTMMKYVL